MRAIVQHRFGGPEVLDVEQTATPEPAPTEVLVRVVSAGVNPVDAKVRQGLSVARFVGGFPFVLGWDVAGTVEAVGAGVTRFAPGDRVFGFPRFPRPAGCYAEFVTAPSRQLATIPRSLDFATASSVPLAGTTAWQIVEDIARARQGQRVLVLGAGGGVGRIAAQLLVDRGVEVVATGSRRSLDELATLGIHRGIERGAEIDEAGLDLVIDLLGAQNGIAAISTLRPGGLVVSVPSNQQQGLAEAAQRAGVRATSLIAEPDRAALEGVARLIDAGQISVRTPTSYGLDEVRRVHELLDAGSPHGRMSLAPGGSAS